MSQSLIGNLLVASSLVQDPVLSRAVCLVVHEDENGLIGVMLNRPLQPHPAAVVHMTEQSEADTLQSKSTNRIADFAESDPGFDTTENDVPSDDFYVEDEPDYDTEETGLTNEMAIEHALANAAQAIGTVHFGGPLNGPVVAVHGASEFAEAETGNGIYVAAQKPNLERIVQQEIGPYRLIVGHLGWDTEQLAAEVEAGIWHIIPATTDDVFASDQEMWPRLIRRATAASVARWIGTPDVPMAFAVN